MLKAWKHMGWALYALAVAGAYEAKPGAVISTDRSDERHVSSRGVVQVIMEEMRPACAFRPEMAPSEFAAWQQRVQEAMARLMKHPTVNNQPKPKMLKQVQRDGYRVEKWEAYPLPQAAVPYLVLVPKGVSKQNPAPAVLCLPGSGQPKELLAGETTQDLTGPPAGKPGDNAMALHYVREGYVAVVVDNAGTGEIGDLQAPGRTYSDDENLARYLLEAGWSWLGYTSYTDQCVLNWMKEQPYIRRNRIILSGFSLGTEPMMVLGVLNPDLYAFVYNDFLCRTLERLQVMTQPNGRGGRPAPNGVRHLIPGYLSEFDFPDVVAALAPRPLICTEGGLDRDFQLIEKAYRLAGAPDNFSYHHQPKYAGSTERWQGATLPKGLNRDDFFRLANVDPRNHFFKKDLALPWLRRVLQKQPRAARKNSL